MKSNSITQIVRDSIPRGREFSLDEVAAAVAQRMPDACSRWIRRMVTTRFHGTIRRYEQLPIVVVRPGSTSTAGTYRCEGGGLR